MADPNNKYKVVVTYNVEAGWHDGYCSDPDEKHIEIYSITEEFDIPDNLQNSHLDDDGEIIDYDILEQFEKESIPHGGGGYCGMETTYEIIEAVVKKRKCKRKIDLGR